MSPSPGTGSVSDDTASDSDGTAGDSSSETSDVTSETDEPVRFGLAGSNPSGTLTSLRLRSSETGEEYDAVGRAQDGGSDLTPLPGYNQFWFAWSVFNHQSEIFNKDHDVDTANFESEEECLVPCEQLRLGCPGKDCIPAITDPVFVDPTDERAAYLDDASYVVGVAVGDDVRAYPHNILWWHEIANDTVGGQDIAVTHCPLTFSSIGHDRNAFIEGRTVELGVSGRLFNSNLVFYDRFEETYYPQLLGQGAMGPSLGATAPRVHVWEMTWSAWTDMFPDTQVMSGDSNDTGHARDYERYPYGSYFTDDGNTFSTTDPLPDPTYPNKALTYGLRHGGVARAYVHGELAQWAEEQYGEDAPPAGVVNDTFGSEPVAIVFDIEAGYVQAFDASGLGELEMIE